MHEIGHKQPIFIYAVRPFDAEEQHELDEEDDEEDSECDDFEVDIAIPVA